MSLHENVFSKRNVMLELDASTRDDALHKIADHAKTLGIVEDSQALFDKFIEREAESTTGFQDGFAIPHAKSSLIKEPQLLYVCLKNPVDWSAMDGKPTKYLFALLIPENAQSEHVDLLSKLSVGLLDEQFTSKLKAATSDADAFEIINKQLEAKPDNKPEANDNKGQSSLNILAITACPVGIAHTYISAEKIEQEAKKRNYNISVETHGSVGIKNAFTDKQLQEADLIIIAADVSIDTARFVNKPIYMTSTKQAIAKPAEVLDEAIRTKNNFVPNASQATLAANNQAQSMSKSGKQSYVMKHLLTGISYMVPFVILGGILIALAVGLGKAIYGEGAGAPKGDFLWYMEQIGGTCFMVMIGVLGAYIAFSIAGKAAIVPAFIASLIGNTPAAIYPLPGIEASEIGMGFIGSILFGLAVGYTVKWIATWPMPKSLAAVLPIFFIPLGVGVFYSLIAIFVLGAPIAFVMAKFQGALQGVFSNSQDGLNIGIGIGMGLLIGAMAGFDMGGPINKIAFMTSVSLISSKIYAPMGMMAAAIPIAPIGMGLCTQIFRNKFSDEEKNLGISAIIMGSIGISEGAIPFAAADPKRAIACNVVGSAVAGAIAAALGVNCLAGHGGPIVAILGAVTSDLIPSAGIAAGIGFFFIAIAAGSAVTCVMYGFWRPKPEGLEVQPKASRRSRWSKGAVGVAGR